MKYITQKPDLIVSTHLLLQQCNISVCRKAQDRYHKSEVVPNYSEILDFPERNLLGCLSGASVTKRAKSFKTLTPELVLGSDTYSCQVDIWSSGFDAIKLVFLVTYKEFLILSQAVLLRVLFCEVHKNDPIQS